MTAQHVTARRELDAHRPLRAVRIPLDKLRVHPRHVRTDMGDLAELARSLATDGQHQMIKVERQGEYFVIHEGHRRFGAAVIAGLRSLNAEVVPPRSDADAVATMLSTSVHTRPLSASEQRDAVRYLVDTEQMSVAEVAGRCGVSVQTVRRWYQAPLAGHPSESSEQDTESSPASTRCEQPRRRRQRTTIGVVSLRNLIDRWGPRCTGGLDGTQAADLLEEIRALLTAGTTPGTAPQDSTAGATQNAGEEAR